MSDYLKHTLLYEFSLGAKVWRYTSNVMDVIDPSLNVWEACMVADDGVATSGDTAADSLSVSLSIDSVPARIWMHAPPKNVMDIRILSAILPEKPESVTYTGLDSTEPGAPTSVSDVRVQYVGEVTQCNFGAPGSCTFTCDTLAATMEREGLRLTWQRACPNVIYACGVDKSLHASSAVIQAINGNSISIDPGVAGNFAGGILEYTHPVKGDESATIESGSGTVFLIFDGTRDLYVGQPVTIYPGCDQSPASCQAFGNYLNFGGIKDLPGKSPFDGANSPSF